MDDEDEDDDIEEGEEDEMEEMEEMEEGVDLEGGMAIEVPGELRLQLKILY